MGRAFLRSPALFRLKRRACGAVCPVFEESPVSRKSIRLLAVLAAVVFALTSLPGVAGAEALFTTADGRQATEDSALIDGVDFGLNAFERNAKGTARALTDQPAGYRFPIYKTTTLVTVTTPSSIVVWVDAHAAKDAGLDVSSAADQKALKKMLVGLDKTHSMGGALLEDSKLEWVFTSDASLVQGDYRYQFKVMGADGDHYTVVNAADDTNTELNLGDGALWSDNAALVPYADVSTTEPPSLAERVATFFGGIDYRPFWVSIKTSGLALAIAFVLGLFAAWKTMGTTSRVKGLLDSVFTIPMVLPPTVCGFLLLMLFGRSTGAGQWLIAHGVSIVFTWPAAVISAVVVSFPLVYRTALGAFESLDTQMLDAARTLGWSERRIFTNLMMPLGWPSIAAGTVLAFARAMGEFGCTLFFAGNYAGITQTIPIAIYFEWMGGNTSVALFWVAVVIVFSFLVILFINMYTAHSQKYRERGLSRAERKQARGLASQVDSLDPVGGDALRIDREALAELMRDDAVAKGGR